LEELFERAVNELIKFGQLGREDLDFLQKVDQASEEMFVGEVEHYIARKYNEEIPKILKKYNLLGIPIDQKYGGLGRDALTYALAMERFGQVSMGIVTFVDVHSSLAGLAIQQWGNEDQKIRYLAPSTRGEKILAYALTEPEAGSDPSSMKTEFMETRDEYILNGSKYLISNGSIADALIVFAREKDDQHRQDKGDPAQITAFIVDSNAEGFSVSMRLEEKMGLYTSDTSLLEFENVRIPKSNQLGVYGKGLNIAYSALANGRIGIASGCVGVLEDCLNLALERARERKQHGKEIGKHQLIQKHIAEIAMDLEMARWPTYIAAIKKRELDRNPESRELRDEVDTRSAIAKKIASTLAFEAADRTVQIFGGFGYSILCHAARHFADSRVARIYEGTDEIMDLKIASNLLGKGFEAYK
jgi:alkylation response protein AidB-like acyl-CoA dehydrogenase